MPKDDIITVAGTVIEALPHTLFRVKLDPGQTVLAYLAGKVRQHFRKFAPGDRVMVEVSPYDLTRGRITEHLQRRAA